MGSSPSSGFEGGGEAEPLVPAFVPPPHPVRFVVTDDLRRSRATVLLRLVFALPHFAWISLWTYAAFVAWVGNWIFTLVLGRSPQALHDFLAAYVRYTIQLAAYFFLVANPYPGFIGLRPYPVDVELPEPARQARWKSLLRPLLVLPAAIMTSIFQLVYELVGIAAWFVALALGRVPQGMRDLSAYCLRYQAQTYAYGGFLTDRYPSLATPPPE